MDESCDKLAISQVTTKPWQMVTGNHQAAFVAWTGEAKTRGTTETGGVAIPEVKKIWDITQAIPSVEGANYMAYPGNFQPCGFNLGAQSS